MMTYAFLSGLSGLQNREAYVLWTTIGQKKIIVTKNLLNLQTIYMLRSQSLAL